MLTDLNALAGQNDTTLDDLVQDQNTSLMPINNKGTANNLAAHAALLVEPEAAVEVYNVIGSEFNLNTNSPTYDNVMAQANQRENDLTTQQMGEILSDESIPLDQKVGMASQWRGGASPIKKARSPQEILGINQIEKEGLVTDNDEVEETRVDIVGRLAEVNAYNSEIQKMVNEADMANSPGVIEAGKNFLEAVVPFMEQGLAAEIQTRLRTAIEEDDVNSLASGIVKSIGLLGESKEDIRKFVAAVPLQDRLKIAQSVYDVVMASEGSILGDTNSMMLMNHLRDYLVEGQYTTADRVVDDITSILDLVGAGATVRSIKNGMSSAGNIAKFTRRSPLSAGEVVSQTNSKSANALIKAAADDDTGELAKSLFNASREDVVVNSVGPEIGAFDGSIRYKPLIDDVEFNPDMDVVRQIAGDSGTINFTRAEKDSKLATVIGDITNKDVTGLISHKEMTTIQAVDDGVRIQTVFGPAEGGFKNGKDAVMQVKLATRKYGLLDDEIKLFRRGADGNLKEVNPNSTAANLKGNYMVAIDHTTPYDPSDTINWSVTNVEGKVLGVDLNLFDKLPVYTKGKGGSITQHLIPPTGYIDPQLTRAASVAVDKTAQSQKLLLDLGDQWAKSYNSVDNVKRKIIDNYIVEANHKSLKLNVTKLRADGWDDGMIDAIRSWKRVNDTNYVLYNTDAVRQSKRKGFQMFVTSDGQDSLLVKPITNSTVGNLKVTKVYDPELGLIRPITSKERTELYKNGGTIAMARTPIDVKGETIAYVKVSNNSHNYVRSLRESDKLMNYREGHFTIYYKDPYFITTVVKNADGTEYTKAIATAANIKDAEEHLKRLQAADPKAVYSVRGDLKGEEFDEMMWNARVNSGLTPQRTRGEMLQDTTSRPTDPNFRHIATPEESLIRSINSISRRIPMKEYLDTSKKRFMRQYDEFLPRNPTTKAKMWPDSVKDLVKPNITDDAGKYHDALSTYRYIDQMENGFVNLLDDVSKNFFKSIATTSGKKGFGWIETAGHAAANTAPTAWARKKAFRLLLAANPVRQVVVQASQGLPVILATNPSFIPKLPWYMAHARYLDRGGDAESFIKSLGNKFTGMTLEEAKNMEKAYRDSGIASAVSAHSLIRDDLKSLVNRTIYDKTKAVIAKPIDVMQKVGFEAGENYLMKAIWLSEYDVLRRSGKKIDAEALNLLHARVRDLTLNMNKAGELAYNENALSAIMQFAQAPHKAFAQIVMGNRALSRMDRLKLGTAYLTVYGTGYGLLYEQAMKLLPENDPELQELVAGGLFNLAMNKTLSAVYGEEVDVDFSSSMRLLEMPNLINMFEAVGTMDLEGVVTSSPSVSLVYGDNARIGNLVKSMHRFFTVPEDDGAIKDVGKTFLSIFSGGSNIFKARYAFQRGQAIDTKGNVVDSDVNEMEAMMRTMGFQTTDEMLKYAFSTKTYEMSTAFKDDVKYLLDETSRRLAREGISEKETEFVLRMYREANRVWEGNPTALSYIRGEVMKRMKGGDHVILNGLIQQFPLITRDDLLDALSKSPVKPEDRDRLIKIYDGMKGPE